MKVRTLLSYVAASALAVGALAFTVGTVNADTVRNIDIKAGQSIGSYNFTPTYTGNSPQQADCKWQFNANPSLPSGLTLEVFESTGKKWDNVGKYATLSGSLATAGTYDFSIDWSRHSNGGNDAHCDKGSESFHIVVSTTSNPCVSNCGTPGDNNPPGTTTDATKYTLTFDPNGGTGAPAAVTVNAGSMFYIPMTAPTRNCYAFKGWALDPAATWALYDPGAGFTATKSLTVYAVWLSDKSCDPKPVVTPTPTPAPAAPKLTCGTGTTTVVSVTPGKIDLTVSPASATVSAAGAAGIGGTHVAGSTLKFFAKPGFSGKTSIKVTATNEGLTVSCDAPVLVQVAPVVDPYFTPIRVNWSSITWVASPNATGYKVYANGDQVCGVTSPRCNVKDIYGPADDVQVKAVGNDGTEAPLVPAAYAPDSLVYIGSVNFDENSANFNAKAKKQLAALAALIEKHGFTKVKAVGNTDDQGGSRNAVKLSKARAAAVAKWLSGKSGADLTTYYYANNWPVASNGTKEGQAKNRRVEVSVK